MMIFGTFFEPLSALVGILTTLSYLLSILFHTLLTLLSLATYSLPYQYFILLNFYETLYHVDSVAFRNAVIG